MSLKVFVSLLAVAAGCANALNTPPFSLEDLGTAAAVPANCTASGSGMPPSWVEMTDLLNYTQYYSVSGDLSALPDPLPFPFMQTATDTKAPGWLSTCIARSPTAPEDCSGDECNVYIEEWGVQWLEFALINCFGGFPNTSAVSFFANPQPGPGEVALSVTQTCKNYYYGPSDEWDFFYSVTDQWGNKWALQTVHSNDTTEEEFDANIDSVVWPEGWAVEKVPLTDTVEMVPLQVGAGCYAMILKDSNFNSWHLYTYPEGGLTSGNSLFGAMGGTQGCTPLDAQYTFENIGEVAGAPAQAPAPAEVPSAAGRPAGTAAGLILGAAAALAVFL